MFGFNKRTKIGTYTLVMVSIVLAAIVIINLMVLGMPSKYTKLDVTALELYTLSDTTLEAIPKIDEKVDIYLLCSGGEDASGSAVNNMPMLSVFLERYADNNDNIKVQIIDYVANPTFTDAYDPDGLENYTIIVESEKRFKIIDFSDLYYYYESSVGRIAPEQYQNFMYYYYYNYGTYPSLTLHFDGESQITSALDYVTTDHIPAIYTLEGHGETAISDTLKANIENDNMTLATLNLLTSTIPEDAECIIINVPTSDINIDEAAMLSEYLSGGGSVFLNTIYTNLALPNLMGVMAEYGLSAVQGMIVEGDSNMHYNNYPYYLLPTASLDSPLTATLASSAYMFMPFSHGVLSGGETDKNVTVAPLFSTSSSAYTIEASAQTVEKTDSSAEGAFDIAVLAKDADSGAQIIWCGSPAFNDNMNSMTGGNYQYFISMLGGIVERDRIVYNIPANQVSSSYLVVNETQANLWGAIFVIIIPLIFAACGIARWYVRRRR